MADQSPTLVVTETVIEEVVPTGATTPSKIQRFVRGQVVSPAQVAAYAERTGEEVPTTPAPANINARLGMIVALTEEDAAPPPAVAPHVEPGPVNAPGVTSEVVAPAVDPEPPADETEDDAS